MQAVKTNQKLEQQSASVEKTSSITDERIVQVENILKIGIVAMVVAATLFLQFLNIIFIVVYCLNIINPPFYFVMSIVGGNFGCAWHAIRRIMNYMFPVESKIATALERIMRKK